mmetsp:Transcript_14411/g.21624  ORF Transcript_14411/g.21624 Transcript_14411/m.21624 type:complete len:1664 (+) Transcript_14411:117-5108(+)
MASSHRVIKNGFLDKQGHGLISTWHTRWFVLTDTSLCYYTDQTLASKKGECKISGSTRITRKPPEGSHKHLLSIYDDTTKKEMLICAPDMTTLGSWERAIQDVIDPLHSSQAAEFCADASLSMHPRKSIKLDIWSGESSSVLLYGYLQKQSNIMMAWNRRWFVLSRTATAYSLCHYTDDTMAQKKGEFLIDKHCTVTRRRPMSSERPYLLSISSGGGRDYNARSGGVRTDILVSAHTEAVLQRWEHALASTVLQMRHKHHAAAVRVSLVTDVDILESMQESVFLVRVFVKCRQVQSAYHFYSDIRDAFNRLRVTSDIAVEEPFPRQYKRSAFGVKLGEDELESRRFQLENCLQELLDKYTEFEFLQEVGGEAEEVLDSIAQLYGGNPTRISRVVACASQGDYQSLVSTPDGSVSGSDSPETTMGDSTKNKTETVPTNTGVTSLFAHVSDSDSEPDEPSTTPHDAHDLRTMGILDLAQLCLDRSIDYTGFKSKKAFIEALEETSAQELPYLHDKVARAVVRRLVGTVEGKTDAQLDAGTITEVDRVFDDLLRLLEVPNDIKAILDVELTTTDKLARIVKGVSLWDEDICFSAEDRDLIASLGSDDPASSFLLLILRYRIRQATANFEWLHRFCATRGVSILASILDKSFEQHPLHEVDMCSVQQILRCFRIIMETECRVFVMATKGTVDSFVDALRFEHPSLALEALDLLSECIIFGGADAVWQVIQGLSRLARSRGEKLFSLLVNAFKSGNLLLQTAILGLVNSIMLYERDIDQRMAMRRTLLDLDFDKTCSEMLKEYRKTGGMRSPQKPTPLEDSPCVASGVDDFESNCGECTTAESYTQKLRAGVWVCDEDMGEGLADGLLAVVHPNEGKMEGYAIEIVEKDEVEGESDGMWMTGDDLGKIVDNTMTSIGKVGRRLSLRRSSLTERRASESAMSRRRSSFQGSRTEMLKESVAARRLWYKIEDNSLAWYASVECSTYTAQHSASKRLGTILIDDIVDIVDYSTLTSKINFLLQNCFTIVIADGGKLHLCFDTVATKHKWLVALTAVRKGRFLRRAPFRRPPVPTLSASVLLKLRKKLEQQVALYRSVAKEDVATIYASSVEDFVNGGGTSASGPSMSAVDLANFLQYELKVHRNEGKLLGALKDITTYVVSNYAPRPVVEEEDVFAGRKYPLAVPDSSRPVPRAPPLPPMPPPKPVKTPTKKVKQLFWSKVKPVNVYNTIWEEVEEPELSWSDLESQFAVATSRRRANIRSSVKGGSNATKKVSLFDSRRTQNVAIACGKLRKTPEELFDLVIGLDPDELTADVNDTILNLLVPTTEELNVIRSYNGEIDELDFCGKLFYLFMDIERLEQRLITQRIMLSWFEQAEMVSEQLNIIIQSVTELAGEPCMGSLRTVMGAILSAGNYMNGATTRGQAHGYRLDTLLKVRNVKQTGPGRRTLLHFVIEQLSMLYPDMPPFYSSWKSMWLAPKIFRESLEVVMKDLQLSLDNCMAEIEFAEELSSPSVKGPLIDRLGQFITSASEAYKDLSLLFDEADRAVSSLKGHFGEIVLGCSPGATDEDPWQTFFALIIKFSTMYKISVQENEDWKKEAEKAKKRITTKPIPKRDTGNRAESLVVSKPAPVPARTRQHSQEDAMKSFKKKLQQIRKMNTTNGSDSSDDDVEW